MDVGTVQKLMGLSAISTTMRYMQETSVPMRLQAFGRHRRTKTHKCNRQQTGNKQATGRKTGRKRGEMSRGEKWITC